MTYKIKSLGYRTDFIFNKLDGSIEDKGDYIVAKTASNPHYFWGNLLLFKRPPQKGDLSIWKEAFTKEFETPEVYHMTLAWDSPDAERGDPGEFLEDGFKLETSVVLTTSKVEKARKFNPEIKIKEVDLAIDFDRVIEIQVASSDDHLTKETWKSFYEVSLKKYQDLIEKGHGKWFGAYIDGILAGTLGLFQDGEVGRFQIVSTHPDYQRRGVCSTLVYESAKYGLEKMGITQLVMIADEEYHAAKIYESVGFKPNQRTIGLCWYDKNIHK